MNSLLLAFGGEEIALCVIGAVVLLAIICFITIVPIRLYFLALTSGAYVSAAKLVSMKKRGIDVKFVVETYITAKKAGLNIDIKILDAHLQAGGNIENVVKAMLLAKQSGLKVDKQMLMAIDKSGENVVKVVESAVIPEVLPFSNVIGMSQDKIELIVSGKITIKANLDKFLGGIQEETLIARISSEIVSLINNSEYYNVVLENPAIVSDVLRTKRLDIGSAFDILSIDITNVRIGENYNLKTIKENAEKKKIEITVETERLKQEGILEEQQAKIRVQEAKIDFMNQEKEYSKQLYEAVLNNDLDALEYFKLKNLQADTEMRKQIAHPGKDFELDALFDDEE